MSRLAATLKFIQSQHLALVCRVVLGATFISSGGSKIGHPTDVIQSVLSYNILPGELVRPFALMLPWIEVISGTLLIVGLMIGSASALLALLNLTFLGAIATNLLRGASIDCGCFGQSEPLSWWIFARDVGFFLMAIQVLFAKESFFSLDTAVSSTWRRLQDWQRLTS